MRFYHEKLIKASKTKKKKWEFKTQKETDYRNPSLFLYV